MSFASSSPPQNSAPSSAWVLFGIDLRTIGQDWLHAMGQLHMRAPLRWFEHHPSVRLLRADQSIVHWLDGQISDATPSATTGDSQASSATLHAIELPESLLLRRTLHLPDLPESQLKEAVWLDIHSSSPFAEADITWGMRCSKLDAGIRVDAAFAARSQVDRYIESVTSGTPWSLTNSEVWAMIPGTQQPVVLQGYAEAVRLSVQGKHRSKVWLALLLMSALLAALAITPTAQLRYQAIQADRAYNQLVGQTSELTTERAALTQTLESVGTIQVAMQKRVNMLEVLDYLSNHLPDDVWVADLQWEGDTITLSAEADNAAAIVQLLGDLEAFSDARTTRPVQRARSGNKDNFTAELKIADGAFNTKFASDGNAQPADAPTTNAAAPSVASSNDQTPATFIEDDGQRTLPQRGQSSSPESSVTPLAAPKLAAGEAASPENPPPSADNESHKQAETEEETLNEVEALHEEEPSEGQDEEATSRFGGVGSMPNTNNVNPNREGGQ